MAKLIIKLELNDESTAEITLATDSIISLDQLPNAAHYSTILLLEQLRVSASKGECEFKQAYTAKPSNSSTVEYLK